MRLDNGLVRSISGPVSREFGVESWDRYWAILEQLRAEAGSVDCLGALPRYRLGAVNDPRLLLMSPVPAPTSYHIDAMIRPLTTLGFGLLCLVSATLARAEPELRRGTILIGVPRAQFVVLGADRLWSTALPRPGDLPSERRGRQMKIALHESLPLAVAAAGLATLGPQQDTVEYIRQLITPLDKSRLNFDTIVELLRTQLHDKLRAVRHPAKDVPATKSADAEAKIRLKVATLTLLVAYVAAGRATLGWLQLDDDWQAKRESPPHGAVAWPDSLDRFYIKGPFAGTAALFGYSIQEPAKLAEHVRRVIEAGIREDARLNQGRNRHVGGPVDVVLIDAKGARCVPSCAPP